MKFAGPDSLLALLRRHAARLLLAAAIIAAAVVAGPRLVLGPEVTVEPVVRRDFVQAVVSSGHVETPHRVDVGVQLTGTVQNVPVAEGQSVAAGAVLIELEAAELRANARQAELAVQQAREKLRQLHEVQAPVAEQALRQAQANYDAARRALARSRDLLERRFIGEAAFDDTQRAAQVAEAQLRTTQQQLASVRPGGSDLAMAEAALAQAVAGATAAQARLRYATVTAPVAGTLIARNVEPGDVVQPGKVLMVLSPAGSLQLVVQIDEKNLRLLHTGLPALASADAWPQERFAAELVYINPGVDAQRGSVEVKLQVPSPPPYLKQDMTVSVDIEVARRPNAVLVPADAVHDPESASPWVLAVERGSTRRRLVKLGLRSGGWCEVLDGLQPGDDVVPVAAIMVHEGERVRPVARGAAD